MRTIIIGARAYFGRWRGLHNAGDLHNTILLTLLIHLYLWFMLEKDHKIKFFMSILKMPGSTNLNIKENLRLSRSWGAIVC